MSILFEKRDGIAYITINRPEAMNALDPDTHRQLMEAFDEYNQDDEMLVAIFTGAGEQAFCSGADLKRLIPRFTEGEQRLEPSEERFFSHIYKPIIAAVNGYCLAGGFEMLLGTDIRIAAEHATFGLPEVKWGIVPFAGAHARLARQIPWAWAMELLLTGRHITAKEALAIGLVNRVVPMDDLMRTAEEVAERIKKNGPLAVRTCKEAVVRTSGMPFQMAFYLDSYMSARVLSSEDAREGPRAFAEKRPPRFKGR
ncbi:MAG: enoyl-CoA hydratase [Bacillus thermozeamaize]|uniref:Enoyl-CoA hydratase n=1 Tax=Bacillus thermozeamaize TaxID=230954 RepID=A0A1Y3PL24_9BACI|nr:MAG: enoyl-CoA hydratase [Bacillus thermozeamaize]